MVKSSRDIAPARSEVINILEKVESKLVRALIAFLFLTGARIGEVVGLLYIPNPEYKAEPDPRLKIVKSLHYLRKRDFNFTPEEPNYAEYAVVSIFTEKKRDKKKSKYRNVPYRKDDPLTKYLNPYLDEFEDKESIFPITRQKALYEIKKIEPRWCNHLMRHGRLSELASRGASDQQLTQFAGWQDSRNAKQYVHLRWQSVADKV